MCHARKKRGGVFHSALRIYFVPYRGGVTSRETFGRIWRMVGRRVFVLRGDVTQLWLAEDSSVGGKTNPICMKDIRFHL